MQGALLTSHLDAHPIFRRKDGEDLLHCTIEPPPSSLSFVDFSPFLTSAANHYYVQHLSAFCKNVYFLGASQMSAFLALHWHVLSVPSTLDGLSPHFTRRPIQSELLCSAARWRAASLVTPSSSSPSSSPSSSSSSSQLPRHLQPTHTFRHRPRQKLRSLQVG